MRAQQLWHWIYFRGANDFDEMTSVAKETARGARRAFHAWRGPKWSPSRFPTTARANGCCACRAATAREAHRGRDASTSPKPTAARCASHRQVGCTLNCSFCHTGTQRLVRNLAAGEIVGQVMVARDGWANGPIATTPTGGRLVTNIVMMGMGEPLYNFDNVRDALVIVADGEGIGISRRRITLSTSGVVPKIVRTGDEIGVDAGDLAARGARRIAQRARAAQQEISDRGIARRPAATIPAPPTRGASRSNM